MLVGAQDLIRDRVLGIGEKLEQSHLLVAFVTLQCFEDCLGREALVNEQRQCGDVERESLGFARPVEEWLAQRLEFFRRRLGLLQRLGLQHLAYQILTLLPRRVLPVPFERG